MSDFYIIDTQHAHLPSIVDNKEALLREVHNYIETTGEREIFEIIINKRSEQLVNSELSSCSSGNLDSQYQSESMAILITSTELFGVPNFYRYIEQQSQSLFGGLLPFWAEYQRFILMLDAQPVEKTALDEEVNILAKVELDNGFHAELVQNIEVDCRKFLTHFSVQPLRLSNANALMNLETFVKQQHWYEMLSELDLSAQGEHFILYQCDEHGRKTLLSSAKIQRWNKKDDWLAFAPFFQSDNWKVSLSDRNIRTLESSGMFDGSLSNRLELSTPLQLDQSFSQSLALGHDCCELIRMAVSGSTSRLNTILYLSIKHIALFMKQVGMKGVYVITEQPALLYFFQSVNLYSDDPDCYVPMTYQQITPTKPYTYKGLILSDPMVKAIGECNYKQYYKQVLSARKKSTTHFASCLKF
ncbi:N-(3-hydroxybutanoyl)-L- homoserine lactone synthase LuxM [Vibrio maritimus]|uniref:acyl-homoserine-lactone synthase n=1 Tax=Vibrio maritimus TaxID=990268 RepID=A0A090T055_9VIBR|nr:N-(3-hydroxybutanoyl)-L- homoserine lactone synthase LuxM [Vibrio maritimus]